MAHHIKSTSGRTHWMVVDGRLNEHAYHSQAFTLTAADTKRLKDLLCECSDEIDQAVEREALDVPLYEVGIDAE